MRIKKAQSMQSGAAAAALVALIAALVVLYILALPPEERQSLLEGDDSSSTTSSDDSAILLSESPGTLYPERTSEFEKEFSPVSVFIGQDSIELKRKDSVYVRRALFNTKTQSIAFEIIDAADVQEALLNFEVVSGKGRLVVELNGREIFNSEVTGANINPVNIKKDGMLKKGMNELVFSVSSPGVAFWDTNEYELKNVLVTATSLKRDAQSSSLSFVVTEEEKKDIKSLRLWFNTECKQDEVGPLDMWINDYSLFSAVPDCGQASKPLEFLPDKLVVGENELKFKTTQGRFLIDHLKLTSSIKETKPRTFYFELDSEQMRNIQNNTMNISLYMKFEDDVSDKQGEIRVNGHLIDLDQTEREFWTNLKNFVEEGTNAVKIVPTEILDVAQLKVEYVDKEED